jgi:hypothetical protein
MTVVDVLLENLRHDISEISEELTEMGSQKRACHIESLLALVVTIIFLNLSQTRFDKFVSHVAQEELLFVHTIR